MSVKTKTFKCKCLFHRRRRDVPLVRSPRDGNKPQYVIPADGVYLVVVRVWANVNSNPFTASVHVDMLSPNSAVSKFLLSMLSLSSSQLLGLSLHHGLAAAPVLLGHVRRLRVAGAGLAACLLPPLARNPQASVLDRGRHLSGDGGEGHVHRRVPEHPQLGQNYTEPHSGRGDCQLCKEVNCKVMKPQPFKRD